MRIYDEYDDSCEIILESGMYPNSRGVWNRVIQARSEPVYRLLVQCGAEPFSKEEDGDEGAEEHDAFSPFNVASRQSDTSIF